MNFSAAQIAEILGGRVEGDESIEVNKLSKIEEGEAQSLTFLANPKYTPFIYETNASIVIVQDDFEAERPIKDSCTLIRVPDAYSSFGKLLELYDQMQHTREGIEKGAFISEKASVDASVFVGSNSYIGDHVKVGKNCKIYNGCYIADGTTIDENTILYPGVQIYHDCVIGKNCVFHAGVIIGSDGFGFSPTSENNYAKLPQIGNVLIEEDVEIGSNSCIDRATMGSTIIHKGVKIDNLVQIGHNAEVGEHTVIVAQTGIAGSSKIGKNCMIGGQVGIAGHLTIGDNVKIAAQSGIGNNVEDGAVIQGSPAFAIGEYQRAYVGFRRLPRLMKVLDRIQKDLKKLTESNE